MCFMKNDEYFFKISPDIQEICKKRNYQIFLRRLKMNWEFQDIH